MPDRAVFLDRDNTIIEDPGYISDPAQVKLLPGVDLAIRSLLRAGYRAVVVTNQSGVARGMLTEETLGRIHDELTRQLRERSAPIDAIYYCPFHPEGTVEQYKQDSDLRKPSPGMLLKAATELKLDLAASWMVGDSMRDIEAGRRAGCRTILLHHNNTQEALSDQGQGGPDFLARNLVEAAQVILRQDAPGGNEASKGGRSARPSAGFAKASGSKPAVAPAVAPAIAKTPPAQSPVTPANTQPAPKPQSNESAPKPIDAAPTVTAVADAATVAAPAPTIAEKLVVPAQTTAAQTAAVQNPPPAKPALPRKHIVLEDQGDLPDLPPGAPGALSAIRQSTVATASTEPPPAAAPRTQEHRYVPANSSRAPDNASRATSAAGAPADDSDDQSADAMDTLAEISHYVRYIAAGTRRSPAVRMFAAALLMAAGCIVTIMLARLAWGAAGTADFAWLLGANALALLAIGVLMLGRR